MQIRTELQHLWAELSEFLADRFGQDVKYGGGPQDIRNLLTNASRDVRNFEKAERKTREEAAKSRAQLEEEAPVGGPEMISRLREIENLGKEIAAYEARWRSMFHGMLEKLILGAKESDRDIPD